MLNKFLVIGFDSEFGYDEVIKDKNLINYIADKRFVYFDNRKRTEDGAYISQFGGIIKYMKVDNKNIQEIMEWRCNVK